jgi:hypothetical protein
MSDGPSLPRFDTTGHGTSTMAAAKHLLESGRATRLIVRLHGGSHYDNVREITFPESQPGVVELRDDEGSMAGVTMPPSIVVVPLWLISHVEGRPPA